MLHTLKCHPEFFKKLKEGRKHFEFRKNDRDLKVNDTCIINEYYPDKDYYTGRYIHCTITDILKGNVFGHDLESYCILSITITD